MHCPSDSSISFESENIIASGVSVTTMKSASLATRILHAVPENLSVDRESVPGFRIPLAMPVAWGACIPD